MTDPSFNFNFTQQCPVLKIIEPHTVRNSCLCEEHATCPCWLSWSSVILIFIESLFIQVNLIIYYKYNNMLADQYVSWHRDVNLMLRSELEFWSPKEVSPSPTQQDQDVFACPWLFAHVHMAVWYSRSAI